MSEQRYIDPSIFSSKEIKTEEKPVEVKTKQNVIDIINLRQIFNEGKENEYRLFDNFSLSIPDFENRGQFISIMGASGCGKTCLLKAISGLTKIPSGEIKICGKDIKKCGNIPMVFQRYSSYDWFTVEFNVALPFIKNGMKKKEALEKARELLKLVDLYEHKDKYAKEPELSGGQLQRVSIARCLATESQIILLDEATGALDIKMKREVQNILLKIFYESNNPTIINVTHSIEEAVYLSNRIIILKAKPCTIYKVVDIDFGSERRGTWLLETEEYQNKVKEITAILNEIC